MKIQKGWFVLRESPLMRPLKYANRELYSEILAKWCKLPLLNHFFLFWSNSCFSFLYLREPIARANGCAVVRTYTGHGINDLFHPPPNIPHYAKNKAVGTMKPGMVSPLYPLLSQCLIIPFLLGLHHWTGLYFNNPCLLSWEFWRYCTTKMLNLGQNWGDVHWPDNWTATTVDGNRSAQFEETLLWVISLFPNRLDFICRLGSPRQELKY